MSSPSSRSCNRRRGGIRRIDRFAISTALLLLRATSTPPCCVHARTLRRGSSSSSTNDNHGHDVIGTEEEVEARLDALQFEIEGVPNFHGPFTPNDASMTDRIGRREEAAVEDEEDTSLVVFEEEVIPGDDNENELHHTQQQQRLEQSCSSDEMLWQFKLQTDNAGSEITWKLEQRTSSGAFVKVLSGPQGGFKYGANTTYKSSACLTGVNMYQLTVLDAGRDGICCGKGKGSFQYAVGGVTEYTTGQTKKTFTTEAVRSFYVGLPPPAPISGRSSSCTDGEQQIGIRIKTDKYGSDNAWELRSLTSGKVLHSVAAGTYADGASRTDSFDICVPNGSYRFTLMDAMGDGMCCENGIGRYMLYINGEAIVHGSDYTVGKKVQHTIVVGYDDTVLANQMSTREMQYLNGHNWRRKMYHEQFGSTYVPLKYDLSLAEDAQYWANQLLTDCDVQGIEHMPGQEQGENLAKNVGFDYESGQLYPVENICRRWFEREETWPYPSNAHFTQGLWRSSRYMGCAESSKLMEDGRTCRIQVCRYARAGNCNMGHFDATVGDNWKIPMLDDDNQCGPICPPNGCH